LKKLLYQVVCGFLITKIYLKVKVKDDVEKI
jgi:hypothetical protein